MKYILKNKDVKILEFDVYNKESQTLGVIDYTQDIAKISIFSDNLPNGIKADSYDTLKNYLITWIDKRKVPENREFVNKIVASYALNNKKNFMDYIDVSLALSLNDTFWIVPNDKDYKWSNYNLYDNKFDKALELVAFNGMSHRISGITSSPEYTTNGMLRKCWHREDDDIYLFKGSMKGFANGGKEPYCEYYMSQVARVLDIDCIDYDLKEFHNQIVSSCRLFTNEAEGYLPIYYCLDESVRKLKDNTQLLNEIAKIYGEDKLKDLLVFDAIIYNSDRHLGNFGMIVDNDTGKILRPAPIFDNGFSIINHLTEDELSDIKTALASKVSYFGYSFDMQLQMFVESRHLAGLEKLTKFEFKKHPSIDFDDKWLEPIQAHIQDRAKEVINLLRENKEQEPESKKHIINKVKRR